MKIIIKRAIGHPNYMRHWYGEPEYICRLTRALVSYGGGMGGCRHYEYLKHTRIKDGVHRYTRIMQWDGTPQHYDIQLNSRFVVIAEDFYLLKLSYYNRNAEIETEYVISRFRNIELIDERDDEWCIKD